MTREVFGKCGCVGGCGGIPFYIKKVYMLLFYLNVLVTVICGGKHMHWSSVGQNTMLIKRTFKKGLKN